ncbi:helix-turn-helix domain-containing protein [Actinopolyspora sp. H202]|uniref:helix-turn-helix domain-containing protein n=1 Tax=Actinopolyspora sp. H202 TaxID=1500456 RepID=UPI003EE732E9
MTSKEGSSMERRSGIPARVRRVSGELRELRARNGLSAAEVSRSLGISMSKLSRMETGTRGLAADDVAALLGLYRVPSQRREEILALVRNGTDRNWWQVQHAALPAMWQDLMRFETEATAIHSWESQAVPGLLQTDEYAEAVIRGTTHGLPEREVRRLVEARIGRQTVLLGSRAPRLEVLLDEPVLRRPTADPGVMRRQLLRLAESNLRPNVTVRVVPQRAGIHPGMEGPFVLLDFPKQPNLVYLEHRGNSAFLEQPEHVDAAERSLWRLRELAFTPDDSSEIIARLADEPAEYEKE